MVQCGGEGGSQHRPGTVQEFVAADSEYTTADSTVIIRWHSWLLSFYRYLRLPISIPQKI